MHPTSLESMRRFAEKYVKSDDRVLDVGAYDVNGSYRPIFDGRCMYYHGLDIEDGPNVDIVVCDDDWGIPPDSYDIVISGQCLEHARYFWRVLEEIGKVIRPGGFCCLIAPSRQGYHGYPKDYWRFMDDAPQVWAELVGGELLESWTNKDSIGDTGAVIGVAREL